MKDTIVQQCLDILKRDDIKYQFRVLFAPVIELIFYELKPYVYICVILVTSIFLMILGILILLIFVLRNKNTISKIM
jgi:hypothetical protein